MNIKTKRFKQRSNTFRAITSLSIEKFNSLYKALVPIYEKSELQRLSKSKRQRKIGGGRKKKLLQQNQLMMSSIYYRLNISQEFLGIIFNLHNCNVSRQINYLQSLLSQIFKIPTKKISLSEAELTEEKIIKLFVDAKEQQTTLPDKGQKRTVTQSVPGKKHNKKLYDENKITLPEKSDLGYYGAEGIILSNKKTKREKNTTRKLQYGELLLNIHSLIFKNIAGLQYLIFA